MLLPFRLRPMYQDDLAFDLPFEVVRGEMEHWSSFPSDHAVMLYALSVGLLFASRKIGLFALVYTTVVAAFPRVYLGLHYPTDILAGALLGAVIAVIANRYGVRSSVVRSIERVSHTSPAFFYLVFFLVSYQVAEMFHGSRDMASAVFTMIAAHGS